jgi:leucine dehydrogenase
VDRSVAIQGLGSVGGYLAGFLREEGAKVYGCDIDAETAREAHREHGVKLVDVDEIYDVEADVFAPCALGAILDPTTIPRLKVGVVAGGANNQLADPERDGAALDARGILYAPDFVINAGGLINVYNEVVGYVRERAMRMAETIFDTTLHVFELAQRDHIPTRLAADRLAEERLASVAKTGPRHWDRFAREKFPVQP